MAKLIAELALARAEETGAAATAEFYDAMCFIFAPHLPEHALAAHRTASAIRSAETEQLNFHQLLTNPTRHHEDGNHA